MVLVLLGVLRYAIPDAPINLLTQLSRERQLDKENMYSFERTKSSRGGQMRGGVCAPMHSANVADQLNNFGVHKRVNIYNLRVPMDISYKHIILVKSHVYICLFTFFLNSGF